MSPKRPASDEPEEEQVAKRNDTGSEFPFQAPEARAELARQATACVRALNDPRRKLRGNTVGETSWHNPRRTVTSSPPRTAEPRFPDYPVHDPPITEVSQVPAELGWDPSDLDVDGNDIEANIERCQKRITQGILPQIWTRRLARYQLEKRKWDNETATMHIGPGFKKAVHQRLIDLGFVRRTLERRQAFQPQISSIKTVARELQSKPSFLRPGQVAYYCSGHRVAGPKPWDLEEFLLLEKTHRSFGGIWVEGLLPGARLYQAQSTVLPHLKTTPLAPSWQHMVVFEFRLPGATQGRKLPLIDDTGADYTVLHEDDVKDLEHLAGSNELAPEIRLDKTLTVNGPILTTCYMLEVRVMTSDGLLALTEWFHVPVLAPQHHTEGQARLSGGWWRHILHVGSGPDNGDVKVSNSARGVCSMIQSSNYGSGALPMRETMRETTRARPGIPRDEREHLPSTHGERSQSPRLLSLSPPADRPEVPDEERPRSTRRESCRAVSSRSSSSVSDLIEL